MPSTGRLFLTAVGTPANGRSSPGSDRVGGREGALGVHVHERVQLGVELLDALERPFPRARARRPRRRGPSRRARWRIGTKRRCRASSDPPCRLPVRGSRRAWLSACKPTPEGIPATIWACPQGSLPVKHPLPESECHERGNHNPGGPVRTRRGRRIRNRDRRARQRGWRAALPRRRHREPGRPRSLRAGLGPARGRSLQTRAAPCRTARADGALGRPPRGRPGRAGDAGPRVGLRAADRHHRRGSPRQPRPLLGHGALVRGPVGAGRRTARRCRSRWSTRAARSPSAS